MVATDPAAPCWAFGPKPATVAFWHRRQAHETAVHAWDADPTAPVDAGLALDGVDEVVMLFFPRQVRLGRIAPLADSLAIEPDADTHPASADRGRATRWVLAGDGQAAAHDSDAPADATVSGPPDVLYLVLWGRIGLGDPRVRLSGDADKAARVLAVGIVP